MRKQKNTSVNKRSSPRLKRPAFFAVREGFTLIELLIVMAVITVLLGAALGSMSNSRYTAAFFTADEKLTSFLRTARTFAVTGKSVLDYTDFDGDSLTNATNPQDYVTPAGFGVAFAANGRIVLFADLHTDKTTNVPAEKSFQDPGANQVNVYIAGKDLVLDEYTFDSNLVGLNQMAGAAVVVASGLIKSVIYSPIFADTTFEGTLPAAQPYLNLQVYSTAISNFKHCFWIHPIAGNPEPMACQ